MNENNSSLLALVLYDLFLVLLLLPAYTLYVQSQYNAGISAETNYTPSSIYGNTTTTYDADTGTIGFAKALFITLTIEIPWWAYIIFVLIPNVALGVIIFDKLRGI